MSKDKVVLIEDDPACQQVYKELLEDLGCEVRATAFGNEGLDIVKSWMPDLVVLDIRLPRFPGDNIQEELGYVICRNLKSNIKTRDIPILMLTAKGQQSEQVEGFDKGADDYVVKGVSAKILEARVRVLLQRGNLIKYLDGIIVGRDGTLFVKSKEDIKKAVLAIIEREFCHIIEKREGYKLLYNDDGTIRKERNIQPILRFLSPLMQSLGIQLEREVETGRGPVDFKCCGLSYRAHIELKRSKGSWERGLKKQLPKYMESDQVKEGIYVVIWYGEARKEVWEKRKNRLLTISRDLRQDSSYNIELIFVDARKPTLPSKL